MRTVGNRLKDADAWWKSGPKVSNTLRERVQRYGLYQALDMTFGFDWRFADPDFPPPRGRLLSGLLGTARRLIPRRIIPSRRNPARGTDTA
jgi:hypothetical protein